MICEGYRTHRGVTGPMNFKSRTFFFGKSCSRSFGAPGCHQRTLFDLANTTGASKNSVETICMFSEGYRTQRGVTGPMNLQKIIRIFFRKLVLQGYWDPGCHLNTLIDLANNALASNYFLDAICLFSEGYRNHRGVTVPMNFKKPDDFFFQKLVLPGFWGPWLPSRHFN